MINIRPNFSNKKSAKDLTGIIIILIIGIGGLFIVSNPIRVVAPKLPMLSIQDWKGSYVSSKLTVSGTDEKWKERQRFDIGLALWDNHGAIQQEAQWFADTGAAYGAFIRNSRDNGTPLTASTLDRDKVASMLFCSFNTPLNNTKCSYFAYWGHWQTIVDLKSDGDEYFSLSDMKQITSRVDQLLLSMGDEQFAAALPLQPSSLSSPYVFVVATPTTIPTQPGFHLSTASAPGMPTPINLMPCSKFQSGETRLISPGTYIFGDVIIDEVQQYDANTASESTVAYFEKESTVTAPFGADCYTGSNDLATPLIQNELQHGCNSKCTIVRFVLVQSDGQHVEIYK